MPEIELKVQTLEEKELKLVIDDAASVRVLKDRIERDFKLGPADKLVIVYDGAVLEDTESIEQCAIDSFSSKRAVVFAASDAEFGRKAPYLARTWDMEKRARENGGGGAGRPGMGAGGRGVRPRVPGIPGFPLPPGMDPSQLRNNPMMQQMMMTMMQQPQFLENFRKIMEAGAAQAGQPDLAEQVRGMSNEQLKAKITSELAQVMGGGGASIGGGGIPGFPGGGGGGGPGLPFPVPRPPAFPVPGAGGSGVAPGGGGGRGGQPDGAAAQASRKKAEAKLKEINDVLGQIFPLVDTAGTGKVGVNEFAAFLKKTRGGQLNDAKAEAKAKQFFLHNGFTGPITKDQFVGSQSAMFKSMVVMVPPPVLEKELTEATKNLKKVLEKLKQSSTESKKDAASPATTAPKADKKKIIRRKTWLPLESDPALVNKYMWKMGVDESKWRFYDVWSFDAQGLAHIPTPVLAVMLLFPVTQASEKARQDEEKTIKEKKTEPPKGVYHVRQTVGNACGTIALLHAVMNNAEKLKFKQGSFFAKFRAQTHGQTSEQRAKSLDESKDLEEEHEVVAREGKTDAKSRAFANLHFISLVSVGGVLYELDGRKTQPIAHGSTNPATFLQDSIKVIKKFMKFAPRDQRYTTIVLAPKRAPAPVAGPAPAGGQPNETRQGELVAQLVAMGIPADKARTALQQTAWSAARAVDHYFSSMM